MIRIATYNIRHASLKGLEAVARTLEATGAELFALQEVDRWVRRSGGVDQAAWLAARLGCSYAFAPSFSLEGGEYGLALLSTHPIVHHRARHLPHDVGLPSVHLEQRVLLTAEIAPAGQAALRIAVTHLGLHPTERMEQARALLDVLGGEGRTLLVGDLNEGRTEPAYRLCASHLADCLEDVGASPLLTYPSERPTIGIDHVLRSADLPPAISCSALPSLASDHLPVVVQLGAKE